MTFDQNGFTIIPQVFDQQEVNQIKQILADVPLSRAGSRSLLQNEWCIKLANKIQRHDAISGLLPADAMAVQCTLFEKSADNNWLVSAHQDISIPVKQRVDHPALLNWSEKEGGLFVQPPVDVLKLLVAVRVHIDNCGQDDGPLRVVPASHADGKLGQLDLSAMRSRYGEICCVAASGDVMIMKPLLLHASSKGTGTSKRRVLHFLFGPQKLPFGLTWPNSSHVL